MNKVNELVMTILSAACVLSTEASEVSDDNMLMARKLREGAKTVIDMQENLSEAVVAMAECRKISLEVSSFLEDVFGDYDIYKADEKTRKEIIAANARFRRDNMLSK